MSHDKQQKIISQLEAVYPHGLTPTTISLRLPSISPKARSDALWNLKNKGVIVRDAATGAYSLATAPESYNRKLMQKKRKPEGTEEPEAVDDPPTLETWLSRSPKLADKAATPEPAQKTAATPKEQAKPDSPPVAELSPVTVGTIKQASLASAIDTLRCRMPGNILLQIDTQGVILRVDGQKYDTRSLAADELADLIRAASTLSKLRMKEAS